MKIALITDTHAGARQDSQMFSDYFFRFYNEIFFPYLEQNKIDTVIHLGDMFDRRKYINFHTLYSWRINVFEKLNKYNTFVIMGNHDIYHKNTNEINSLRELLSYYDNIKVISDPTVVDFMGTGILLMPWLNSLNEEKYLERLKKTKARVVMGHFEIIGFEMFRGNTNKNTGLTPEEFSRFEVVCSGHYHHKSTNNNIHYLGSPYHMTWNDYGDERGFHVFDTQTQELEFIPNTLEIFHKIKYNDDDMTYEDLIDIDLSRYTNCYVKVIIEKKTNQILFNQFLEAIGKENPADVSVIEEFVDSLSGESIDETKDTLTLLIEYVQGLNIYEDNKQPLIELLRRLYTASQNIEVNDDKV